MNFKLMELHNHLNELKEVEGGASFQNGDTIAQISKGDVLFVEAHKEHKFFDITEDLSTLVFFSPAEHANK